MVLDPPGNRAFVHQKIQKMRCGSAAGASAGSGAGKYDLKAIGGKRPALLDQPGGGTFSESARGLFFPVRTYYGIFCGSLSPVFYMEKGRRLGICPGYADGNFQIVFLCSLSYRCAGRGDFGIFLRICRRISDEEGAADKIWQIFIRKDFE